MTLRSTLPGAVATLALGLPRTAKRAQDCAAATGQNPQLSPSSAAMRRAFRRTSSRARRRGEGMAAHERARVLAESCIAAAVSRHAASMPGPKMPQQAGRVIACRASRAQTRAAPCASGEGE
jgi:hypothetical protein